MAVAPAERCWRRLIKDPVDWNRLSLEFLIEGKNVLKSAAVLTQCLVLGLFSISAAPAVDKGKTVGLPSAPLTIEIFSDFQCPACRMLHTQILPMLIRDFVIPGKAYLINRDFPLAMHNHSMEAAAYACAAARIGKYEQVADTLFRNQPAWAADGKVFEAVASVLTSSEQAKVRALAKDPGVLDEVQQELHEGQADRVNQTPTMVITARGRKYPVAGVMNYDLLKHLLDDLLTR